MSDGRIGISEYGDLARRTTLSVREVDAVVRLLNETSKPVLVLEEWLCDKKDLRAVENERRVYSVGVLDETAKAWRVRTGDHDDWIPKSQSEVFERASGVSEISTPSKTLSEFGGTA